MKPLVAYDTDYMLRAGDIEVEIEHVGSGRTKADSVVLFRELRVVAVGDLFTAGTPQPDCAGGGSFAGWARRSLSPDAGNVRGYLALSARRGGREQEPSGREARGARPARCRIAIGADRLPAAEVKGRARPPPRWLRGPNR